MEVKNIMRLRLVSKLWDETFEMTFLWKYSFEVWRNKSCHHFVRSVIKEHKAD